MSAVTAIRDAQVSTDEVGEDAGYLALLTASVEAGLADADAGEVVELDELESWLAARRSERPGR